MIKLQIQRILRSGRAISSVGKSAPLIRVRSLVRIQDSPRGYSSVGRALPLQGRCQRFESAYLQSVRIFWLTQVMYLMHGSWSWRKSCIFMLPYVYMIHVVIRDLIRSQKNKGLWWIPRHPKTMKGVLTDDTLRGAGMTLWSGDSRIGQPIVLLFEFIEKKETT